ncbi:MAG TPA: hypothetical protein VGB99_17560 [Acidobacteriota bacterium]
MESSFKLVTARDLEPKQLESFMHRTYGPVKGAFLTRHGGWWYRGEEQRWAVLANQQIAAYCGVIPTVCRMAGVPQAAVWWVDLFVAPEFRGFGLQRLFDQAIRHRADLKLGFPNRLAARIHLRHGWGVREDFRMLLLPLAPTRIWPLRAIHGLRGAVLKAGAGALGPAARWLRGRLSNYAPRSARLVDDPNSAMLAELFARHQDRNIVTSERDSDFIQWRYLDAPYRGAMRFYLAGPPDDPRVALISRTVDRPGCRMVRILDLFGALSDRALLRDVLLLCLRDSVHDQADQVTMLATQPALRGILRSIGFVAGAKVPFCWHSEAAETAALLQRSTCHFCLADSDHDEPG